MSPRKRKSDAFVEAVLDDRPLPQGRIDDPDDLAALRAAIELRAGREGADLPDQDFIAALADRLSDEGKGGTRPATSRPATSRRAFLAGTAAAVAAGAAGIVLDRTVFGSGSTPPTRAQA